MIYYSGRKKVTAKFHRCVKHVKRKSKGKVNPYAVCMKSLKVTKVVRHHRKKRRKRRK